MDPFIAGESFSPPSLITPDQFTYALACVAVNQRMVDEDNRPISLWQRLTRGPKFRASASRMVLGSATQLARAAVFEALGVRDDADFSNLISLFVARNAEEQVFGEGPLLCEEAIGLVTAAADPKLLEYMLDQIPEDRGRAVLDDIYRMTAAFLAFAERSDRSPEDILSAAVSRLENA